MTVYVDAPLWRYGRMKTCHLMADTEEELLEMVDRIGVARKHHQHPGTARSHFDICLSKRRLALWFGAKEADSKELVLLMRRKREEGQ